MSLTLYKYHGAGNDFLLADNRDGSISLSAEAVRRLCDRHTGFGSDGLMLLEKSDDYDFSMHYWNPDGSSGMMCGNGGRCLVAFAADLGLDSFRFIAADGPHFAQVLSRQGREVTVRLGMKDVAGYVDMGAECDDPEKGGFFLDTGTRHYVRFVDDVENVQIETEGALWRHDSRFAPQGTNVNFVSVKEEQVKVRTFEKGVEAETLACGTGIVATAMASFIHKGVGERREDGSVKVNVQARIARLSVEFVPGGDGTFSDVWLTGPAERVGTMVPEDYLLD